MRKFKFLFILITLLLIPCLTEAGETYYDMPVTVNVTGGCVLTTPNYSVTVVGTFPDNSHVFLNDYTFTLNCTSGVSYTIKSVNNPAATLYSLKNSSNQYIYLKLFKSDKTTNITNDGTTIATGVGTGQDQQFTISPAIYTGYKTGAIYSCNAGNCTVPADTYSATLQIKVTW